MNKLTVTINNTALPIKEYQGERVVTLKEIDAVHERPEGTARKRFNDNKKHFIEGVDFFTVTQPSEIRTLGMERPQGGTPESVTLITESGYLMLVKSFTDDLAWVVQRQLVNTYFQATPEQRQGAARVTEAQAARLPALSSVNMAVKLSIDTMKSIGVSPEYIALTVANAYRPYGINIPECCLPEGEKLFECEAIAKTMGVMSESGKPHKQAISAIINLVGVGEGEVKMVPFSNSGYSNTTAKYTAPVLERVRSWLEENGYPSKIRGADGKQYSVRYALQDAG